MAMTTSSRLSLTTSAAQPRPGWRWARRQCLRGDVGVRLPASRCRSRRQREAPASCRCAGTGAAGDAYPPGPGHRPRPVCRRRRGSRRRPGRPRSAGIHRSWPVLPSLPPIPRRPDLGAAQPRLSSGLRRDGRPGWSAPVRQRPLTDLIISRPGMALASPATRTRPSSAPTRGEPVVDPAASAPSTPAARNRRMADGSCSPYAGGRTA